VSGGSSAELQELIDQRGTSQRALARDSGISFATISRMCRNVTAQGSLETLARLARALGDDVTPGDLVEFSRDKASKRR
jgi:transcriptional regulator with XRE-family HTH domain